MNKKELEFLRKDIKVTRKRLKKNWFMILVGEIFIMITVLIMFFTLLILSVMFTPIKDDSPEMIQAKENVRISEQNHEKYWRE